MIRVGWLPSLSRPSQQRKRTLSYRRVIRRRSRRNIAPPAAPVNHGDMIFDQPPAKLPVATLMSKSRSTQLATGVYAWLAARWRWFRPRTVPMIAAFVGLFAVVGFANYLKNYGRDDSPPERLTPATPTERVAEETPPIGRILIKQGPDGADIYIDGKRLESPPQIDLKPSHCHNIETVYK